MTAPDAAHSGWLYAALRTPGVLVRLFDKPSLDNKLRIVGAPEENDALLAALDAALAQEPSRTARSTTA